MEVICLQTQAFYGLVEEVVKRLRVKHEEKPKWIPGKQAMKMLNITSRTTLQKLRNEGLIRFTQPTKKLVLYDRESILTYLESNAQETF